MKRENRKTKSDKADARKKPSSKPEPAANSGSQGTAGTIRRWVETLDRIGRTQSSPADLAGILSNS
jgi:hypothetical protein